MSDKKIRILFLVPYQLDTAPGQRFRFEYYFPFLKQNNVSFTVRSFLSRDTNRIFYKRGHTLKKITGTISGYLRRFRDIFSAIGYDYVFVFREATPAGPPVIEWIISRLFGKKMIYDFDDAIWINDPNEKRVLSFIKQKSKVKSICKWSYRVVVGNEYLASFAAQYNDQVHIIPTVIDTEVYQPGNHQNNQAVIGWTGSHSTLIYLNEIMPVLRELRKKHNFSFLIIANEPPDFKDDFVTFSPWKSETEVKDLLPIDIGLMPLTETPWSAGKCGLKILQYHALAIPAIASDVGVNGKIIKNGQNGFICRNSEEWSDALEKLLQDRELRITMGQKGRKQTVQNYSVKATRNDFLNLFS